MRWRRLWLQVVLGHMWLIGQAIFTYHFGLAAGVFCFGGGLVAFCLGLVKMTPDEAELLELARRELDKGKGKDGEDGRV